MDKKPIFFRDEGEIGDVLDEAKRLLDETRTLEEKIRSERESIDEYREEIENARCRQAITGLIKGAVEHPKRWMQAAVAEWNERKAQLDTREAELKMQQQSILEAEARIDRKINEVKTEQREKLSEELEGISRLSADVRAQLEKIEETKKAIDSILAEDVETIKDRLLTREDVQFAQLNYTSLLRSRLADEKVVNPLTGKRYNREDWRIDSEGDGLVARVARGMFSRGDSIRLSIKFIPPQEEEGFIFKRVGRETSHLLTEFIQGNDYSKDSFNSLVLASATGWSDWVIEKVREVRSTSRSVYLVDLGEREIFFNEKDKKTASFAEWFIPVPIEDEISEVVLKLEEDIENGVLQFRADKVGAEYQVPRKVVMGAFRELVDRERGEMIYPEEGAKDVILMVR